MPAASDVYRKYCNTVGFDPAGVVNALDHVIFYKHANPEGLLKNLFFNTGGL